MLTIRLIHLLRDEYYKEVSKKYLNIIKHKKVQAYSKLLKYKIVTYYDGAKCKCFFYQLITCKNCRKDSYYSQPIQTTLSRNVICHKNKTLSSGRIYIGTKNLKEVGCSHRILIRNKIRLDNLPSLH